MLGRSKLVFCYDIVCPYARLAAMRVESIASRTSATLELKPILLGGLYQLDKAPQGTSGSATDIMSPIKQRYNTYDLQRQASRLGSIINMPAKHPQRSLLAQRILTSIENPSKR